jgi:hypothetical protein
MPSSTRRTKSPWRLGAAAVLSLVLAALLAVPAVGADNIKPPRRPFVGSRGLFARAKQGSFCVTRETGNTGVGLCGDAAPPTKPPGPRITVKSGDRIVMLFRHRHHLRDRPGKVHVSLGRIHDGKLDTFSGRINAHRIGGHPRRWQARAPRKVKKANLLTVAEIFAAGDAEYFVGLRR